MKKYIWGILVIIIVILVVLGLTSKYEKESGTIRIGGAYALTGPTAAIGELQKNGSYMAIEKINASGGINGRRLELVIEDSAYDPKTAVNAYQALKLQGIRYYIADGSPVAAPIRKLAVDDGNVVMVPGATTPAYFDGDKHTCRIALTAKNFGPAYADLLAKHGYMNVATLLPDNEYGRGLLDEFTKAFALKGGKVILAEFYNATAGAGDYRTSITKVKAVQPNIDAIVFAQVANTLEGMMKQFKEIGISKPLVTDYYTVNNPALKDLSAVEGIEYVDYEYSKTLVAGEPAESAAFKSEYKRRFGADPTYFPASYVDSVNIIAKALREVGDDPEKVADYISKLQGYKGITGTLSFNSDCEVMRNTFFRKIQGGKITDLN